MYFLESLKNMNLEEKKGGLGDISLVRRVQIPSWPTCPEPHLYKIVTHKDVHISANIVA